MSGNAALNACAKPAPVASSYRKLWAALPSVRSCCYRDLKSGEQAYRHLDNIDGVRFQQPISIPLRDRLVETALAWQGQYGVAPAITTAISEYDAAIHLLGMSEDDYRQSQLRATAVQRGYDFIRDGVRYQIKANRPSGRPGSKVTLCGKARNYDWDYLIWILYDREYHIQEAWQWAVTDYIAAFDHVTRISPDHMRGGKYLEGKG